MTTIRRSLSDVSFLSGLLYGALVLVSIAALLSGRLVIAIVSIILAGYLAARMYL